jgi:hypothetical protein
MYDLDLKEQNFSSVIFSIFFTEKLVKYAMEEKDP